MPANSRWDLIRGLKGQHCFKSDLSLSQINSITSLCIPELVLIDMVGLGMRQQHGSDCQVICCPMLAEGRCPSLAFAISVSYHERFINRYPPFDLRIKTQEFS